MDLISYTKKASLILSVLMLDWLTLNNFNLPLVNDAAGYVELGRLYSQLLVEPSLSSLTNLGMTREPLLPAILGVLFVILPNETTVIFANMAIAHILFVFTVRKIAMRISANSTTLNASTLLAIFSFGLFDYILIPFTEPWLMIFMGQLLFYIWLYFFSGATNFRYIIYMAFFLALMLLTKFGHSLAFMCLAGVALLIYFRTDKLKLRDLIIIPCIAMLLVAPVIIKNKILFDRYGMSWSGGKLHLDYRLRVASEVGLGETWKGGLFHIHQDIASKIYPYECYFYAPMSTNNCKVSMFNTKSEKVFLPTSALYQFEKTSSEEEFSRQIAKDWEQLLSKRKTYLNFAMSGLGYVIALPFSESIQFTAHYKGSNSKNIFLIVKVFYKFILGPCLLLGLIFYAYKMPSQKIFQIAIMLWLCWNLPLIMLAWPNHRYVYPSQIFIYPFSGFLLIYYRDKISQFLKIKGFSKD